MKNTLIVGIECAKDHAGNHQLHHAGKFCECAGCGEYYTIREVAAAVPHSQMLARGLKKTPMKLNSTAK